MHSHLHIRRDITLIYTMQDVSYSRSCTLKLQLKQICIELGTDLLLNIPEEFLLSDFHVFEYILIIFYNYNFFCACIFLIKKSRVISQGWFSSSQQRNLLKMSLDFCTYTELHPESRDVMWFSLDNPICQK